MLGRMDMFNMLYFMCKLTFQKQCIWFLTEDEHLASCINVCICYFQEAMRQVPDCEDEPAPEVPQVTPSKKKRRTLVQVKPLPPAGKGILISPGFRCINVCTQICKKLEITET
jgi:hypothetical protein